ncbi:MAG TPA: hypothetical protein VGZ03_11615 [Acidimicrobiales bacterium]|nr:hypothetical protein [Acidimicrobiales bacterium]
MIPEPVVHRSSEVPDDAAAPSAAAPGEDPADRGPWSWAVTWGVLARPGFVVEHVVAFDADEALVLAAQRRPELERPQVAFVVTAR